jgi:GNAT superfamily N-acetyltransferase
MRQEVRAMVQDDAAEIGALERMARALLVEQRGGPAHMAERPAVGEWVPLLSRPDQRVFIALIDEVPVGYLQLSLIAGHAAEVQQVFVHPDAREVGFGDWLLEAAIDAARSFGCTVIEGTALPGDRETKNLYERAGIKARKITVSLPLQARRSPLTVLRRPSSSAGASR